jgi:hypothetical protein
MAGFKSGQNSTGNNSTIVGANAGQNNDGFSTTIVGSSAGLDNIGNRCVMSGTFAGQRNDAQDCTMTGFAAGLDNSGQDCTMAGANAGQNNTGNRSTMIGNGAGQGDGLADPSTMGDDNIGVGVSAIRDNQASGLIAIGQEAGRNATTDDQLIITDRNGNRRMVMDLTTGDLSIEGGLTENASL